MPKFEQDDLVAIKGTRQVGRIVRRVGNRYSVFTFDRKQAQCDARRLRKVRETFFLLESNLSEGVEALKTHRQRRSGVFFEEYFRSFPAVDVLRERVHSVRDLAYFMRHARASTVRFIHYAGHGAAGARTGTRLETSLYLTTEVLTLPRRSEEAVDRLLEKPPRSSAARKALQRDKQAYLALRSCFEGLGGKILMFSACEVGRAGGLAQYVSKISGALAVIAYSNSVWDHQTNAAEALLYWQLTYLQSKKVTPAKIVQRLRETSLDVLAHNLPITCFVDGEQVVGKKAAKGRAR